MSWAIWKFPLSVEGDGSAAVRMPRGRSVCHIAEQHGRIVLWAEVDTEQPLGEYRFRVVATGEELPAPPGSYLGTAFLGSFVWHVYEKL